METLRPYLLPLTSSLPTPIVSLGHQLLGEKCYTSLLLSLDLSPSNPCLSLAVSKLLGVAIITSSAIIKLPQILKMVQAGSAAGISLASTGLEMVGYVVTVMYSARMGFPFTGWGEGGLLALQDAGICVLVLLLGSGGGAGKGRKKGAVPGSMLASGFVAVMAAGVYALQDPEITPMGTLRWLQGGAGALGVVSKVPQVWSNWQMGGTGMLSALTVFMYLAGSLSRIFTTLQEVDDKLILYGFVGGFLLNAVLAAQMVYYWRSPATAKHAEELGEKPKEIAMGSSTGSSTKGKGPSTRRRG